MAEHQIPPKFRKFAEHLMATLWPGVRWPHLEMVLEDELDAQGTMQYQLGASTAKMRLARKRVFLDFTDTASTIGHELTHLAVDLIYGETSDGHGPEWRGEMDRIGLPVPANTTREKVKRGGLFWQALQEFLALELAPELAPDAAADAALAAGMNSSIVDGEGTTEAARAHAAAANAALGSNRAPAVRHATSPASPPAPVAATRAAAPARTGSGSSPWSVRGALSSMFGGGSSERETSSASTPFTPIVAGPKAGGNRQHLVFADCSKSMLMHLMDGKTLFEVQRNVLNDFFKTAKGKIKLCGFAGNTVEIKTPDELLCDSAYTYSSKYDPGETRELISGSSFYSCFEYAAYLSMDWFKMKYPESIPEHIHLFSDGEPNGATMEQLMESWNKTTCDVSTYYIGQKDDWTAISIMASLARGNGVAYAVTSEAELIAAVRGETGVGPRPLSGVAAVPFNVQARPARSWDPERQEILDHTKGVIKNQTHVVRIAATVAEAMARLSEAEQEIKGLKFANQASAAVVEHANQALDVIEAQQTKDEEARRIAAAQTDAWIEGAGSELNRLSSQHFGNQLLTAAQQIVDATNRTVLPSITLQSINPSAVARATALMSGRNTSTQALPTPQAARAPALPQGSRVPALPSPTNVGAVAPASREVALGPANQFMGRDKVPVRRG